MQWDDSANAGFTDGTPWIEVNPNYTEINAGAEQKDPDSVFHYYQKLVRLRKEQEVLVTGSFELLMEEDPQIFAYTRTSNDTWILVCANFSGTAAVCPILEGWKDARTLIHNYNGEPKTQLKPYEAFMLIRDTAEEKA